MWRLLALVVFSIFLEYLKWKQVTCPVDHLAYGSLHGLNLKPFQKVVLFFPRSVKLKLSFKKFKIWIYPSNEGNNLYQHFKRRTILEITHLCKFLKMLKSLCYKVWLVIQNIGNIINYNHSLLMSHTHSLVVKYDEWWLTTMRH